MHSWWLQQERELHSAQQWRKIRPIASPQGRMIQSDGKSYLNFASNNYLGLAQDPRIITALQNSAAEYGLGSGASRLVNGSLRPLHELEAQICSWKGSEAALLFGSGYMANLGVLSALATQDDIIFSDELNHASMIDGIRLSSAQKRIYPHLDSGFLYNALHELRKKKGFKSKIIIATESVFSMDGDVLPLKDFLDIAFEFDAYLYLDEAHATGVFGQAGAGLAQEYRQHPAWAEHLIQMGTLGKALGCFGAYVTGAKFWRDFLINHARTQIFATALPPALASAAQCALTIVQEEKERRNALWKNLAFFKEKIQEEFPEKDIAVQSPIIPFLVGENEHALEFSRQLEQRGIWISAIRPPTVPVGTARLRITLMSEHCGEDVSFLIEELKSIDKKLA